MKSYFNRVIAGTNYVSLAVGVIIGIAVGLCVFSWLVPSGVDMIKFYHLDGPKEKRLMALSSYTDHGNVHNPNPYVMGAVTSEKQFAQEMIKHHEAAIIMSRQLLALNPGAEFKKLADNIISSQTTEIKMMKGWLTAWK